MIAFVLCAFVAVVFFSLGTPIPGVIFAVVAVACLGVLAWARRGLRRAKTVSRQKTAEP